MKPQGITLRRLMKSKAARSSISAMLAAGGVGIMPTDTIYGIIGCAKSKRAVEKIYRLRRRDPGKPFIILISSVNDLNLFGIKPRAAEKKILKRVWPGKASVILDCRGKQFKYLHRGLKSLAFRLPKNGFLVKLLKSSGPLVAPSANWEGKKEAQTISEAKKYFGGKAAFYIDGGKRAFKPSTLIKIENGFVKVLRKGPVRINLLEPSRQRAVPRKNNFKERMGNPTL